jgi:DNA polymerase delta subunit 1
MVLSDSGSDALTLLFQESLNRVVLNDVRGNKDSVGEAILSVEVVMKESIFGFQGNKKSAFLKITVAQPRLIAPSKRLLERGEVVCPGIGGHNYQAFESNIDYEIRSVPRPQCALQICIRRIKQLTLFCFSITIVSFMVDTDVVGCSWIELPAGTYSVRERGKEPKTVSRCQIEVDVSWTKFVAHPAEGDWSDIAPFRILSFDIECAGRPGWWRSSQNAGAR